MRRTAVMIVAACLLAASLYGNAQGQTTAVIEQVKIVAVKGDVRVMSKPSTEWSAARNGMPLKEGDRIKTAERSTCDLSFDKYDMNIVGVMEKSDVIILLDGDTKIELVDAVVYGKLSSIPSGSKFEIKTPRAICGVRGTGLGVAASNRAIRFMAFENSIYVKGKNGSEISVLEAGSAVNVDASGKLSDKGAVTEKEKAEYGSWLSLISANIMNIRVTRDTLDKVGKQRKEEKDEIDQILEGQ